jgi:hypothetical protein
MRRCGRAVEGLAGSCGPGDRRTLSAALRLAVNLRWQAKYAEAEELFRRSLETARRELGETDRVTPQEFVGSSTVYSIVACPQQRRLWLAHGAVPAPSRGQWSEITWP